MTIPNIITIIRFVLIPVFSYLVLYGRLGQALVVFFFAAVSDVLDGVTARLFQQRSTLGSFLDPIVDKVLLSTAFVVLGVARIIPLWVMVLVLARDLVVLGGLLFLLVKSRGLDLKPSWWGKIATGAQACLVIVALGHKSVMEVEALVLLALWVTVASTVMSGGQYIYLGLKVISGSGEGVRPF